MVYSLFQLPVNESLKKCRKKAVNQKYTKPTCETRTPAFESNKSSPRLSHLYVYLECKMQCPKHDQQKESLGSDDLTSQFKTALCKMRMQTERAGKWSLFPRQRAARHLNNHTQELLFFTKIKLDSCFKSMRPKKNLNISNPATKNNILLMVPKKNKQSPGMFLKPCK